MSDDSRTDFWGVIEIMGHKRLAGRITEQVVGGHSFIRIDVPAGNSPAWSKLFGPAAIYGITPTTEDVALVVADQLDEHPLQTWDFPESIRVLLEGDDDPGF